MFKFLWVLGCVLLNRHPPNLIARAAGIPDRIARHFDFISIIANAAPGHEAAAIDEARRLSFHLHRRRSM